MKNGISIGLVFIVVVLVIMGVILFSTINITGNNYGKSSNFSSAVGSSAKVFIGSCSDYIQPKGLDESLHSCVEYWGINLEDYATKCIPINEYRRTEWSTNRCPAYNATGACRLSSKAIIYVFEKRIDSTWCTENYKGNNLNVEFIPKDEFR